MFSLMPMISITRVKNTNGKNFLHRKTLPNIIKAKIRLADHYVHYSLHTYTAKKSWQLIQELIKSNENIIVQSSVSQTFCDCVPASCFLLHCVPTGSGRTYFAQIYQYVFYHFTSNISTQHNLMRWLHLLLLHKMVYPWFSVTYSTSKIMSRLS